MSKYGAILSGIADAQLESSALGAEYIVLGSDDAKLVRDDYMDAANKDRCTAREYARRIGTGNLAAYVACLRVHAVR